MDRARDDGFQIITVPDNIRDRIRGETDLSGNPIRDLGEFKREWNDSFEFKFVHEKHLRPEEREIFNKADSIFKLIDGKSANVREIKISETMRMDNFGLQEATGIWEEVTGRIIIKRTQLGSLKNFAGTLLHEIAHAISGATDVSSEFEKCLTELLGRIASKVDLSEGNGGIFSKLFGS